MSNAHPLVRLAKEAVETYVRQGRLIAPPPDLPAEAWQQAGAFVSLKVGGELRGCIGTVEPSQPSVAEEVIFNAIRSASEDPRFPPVATQELPLLSYSVDVLAPAEPVSSLEDLDPQRYGLIVRNGSRRGLLLPAIEGVETAEQQLLIARLKAALAPDEPAEMYRFQVQRYD